MYTTAGLMVQLALKNSQRPEGELGPIAMGSAGEEEPKEIAAEDEQQEKDEHPGEEERPEKEAPKKERDRRRKERSRDRRRERRSRSDPKRSEGKRASPRVTAEKEKEKGSAAAPPKAIPKTPPKVPPVAKGVAVPASPPPKAPIKTPPRRPGVEGSSEPVNPPPAEWDEESWGKWKEQQPGETGDAYRARLRSIYGKAKPSPPTPVESKAAASTPAKPKAANYYEVDGGEWLWWDENGWGEKWEPGKKNKEKKRKYTQEEWDEWFRQHPEEMESESSTPRTSTTAPLGTVPKSGPVAQAVIDPMERPRIRPHTDLIRRPEDKQEWMRFITEMDMRMVEYAVTAEAMDWLNTPPKQELWGDSDAVSDLWRAPQGEESSRLLVRIHYKWRENSFHPDHPTLPKKLEELQKFRVSLMRNRTDQTTDRKVILDYLNDRPYLHLDASVASHSATCYVR
eukprot:s890_g35.t1